MPPHFCRSRESEESSVPPDSEAESATSPEAPPKAKRPRAKAAHALEVAKQGRLSFDSGDIELNISNLLIAGLDVRRAG